MSEEKKKWYRVIDPLSPLHGCDVSGREWLVESGGHLLVIDGVRRVDIFVGDRPFQRMAGAEQNLGLYINFDQLEDSLIQDEVVELARDKPYGIFLNESNMTRLDGHTLRVVQYERATQVALDDDENEMLGSVTILGHRDYLNLSEAVIVGAFEQNEDPMDIIEAMNVAADMSKVGRN